MNTPRTCPALLIAAPASGQGKTTVTAALARLHTRQGRRVRVFKCGPDFLDPFWHELASGAPVHNVDLWLTGEDDIRTRLHAAAAEADLLLIEGVMGLYDGTPSAADIARLLGLPVLLVADASAVAQTFGAVVQGLRGFAPQWDAPASAPLRWAGVLANRVGSERHAQMLAEAVTASTPPSAATVGQGWLGALPRQTAFSLPERHLGLVAAHELPDALTRLDALADALAATPLGQMDSAALQQHWAVRFTPPAQSPAPPRLLDGQTVAVARDAAFCFIHAANLDTLQQLGARVVFFSPLVDPELPACDAVWLPGGYPELHAATLHANTPLRAALQNHVAMGRPIWAECGGMMLLFDQLTDKAGQTHAMWGLLPGHVTMQQRLVALGPQQLRGLGTPALRGHTFHWSLVDTPLKAFARTCGPDASLQAVGQGGEALYVHGPIRASYFHAWFASAPEAIAALLRPQPLRWANTAPPAKGESPEGGRGFVLSKDASSAEEKGISPPKQRPPRGPQRIVCLTEETTEWLYRLGREDRIVGISGYTVRPRRARDEKPKVSAFLNAKIDKILELRPDCVLGFSDLQADIAAQLMRAGVQVTVFNQRSVAEIVDVLYQVAALVDALDEGQRQLDDIRHHLHQLEAAAQAADAQGLRRPRVWFEEWNDPPISAIRWVSELLTLAGGEDCFPELAVQPLGKHRIVADPSEIIRRNPDIVIGSWCGKKFRPEQVTTRAGWADVSAVRTQSLYEIKSADILQPGPAALTDGVAQLAALIQAWRQQHG